jgi:transcriptional regulator with XRE-family HTH domain
MPRKREKGPYKYELVGARLREWRESIGLSLEVLATRVGYSVSGYKKIERGEHKASPELLQKLHDLFGVGPETFLISAERSALVGADEWGTVLRGAFRGGTEPLARHRSSNRGEREPRPRRATPRSLPADHQCDDGAAPASAAATPARPVIHETIVHHRSRRAADQVSRAARRLTPAAPTALSSLRATFQDRSRQHLVPFWPN